MLKIDDCLVLMIDLQDKLVQATSAEKEVDNVKKLILSAQALNIPVVVTEQYPKGLGSTVVPIKEVLDSEKTQIIEKTSFSAIAETAVCQLVENLGKKQVLLFGIELHICVYQTAMELLDKGYEVFILKDLCKSRADFNFETGLDLLKVRGAVITSLEIVLFELLRTSKHPKFKEIQSYIK